MCRHELLYAPDGSQALASQQCLTRRNHRWTVDNATTNVTLSGNVTPAGRRTLQLTLVGGHGTLRVRTTRTGTWSIMLTAHQALSYLQLAGHGTNTASVYINGAGAPPAP
jgi:hypothetical protein